MRGLLHILLPLLLLLSCRGKSPSELHDGTWRGVLEVMDGQELPFNFGLKKNGDTFAMEIYNGEEVVTVNEITLRNDSIRIDMPVYEGYISGTFGPNYIDGSFINDSRDRIVPFHAEYGDIARFHGTQVPVEEIDGSWEVIFKPGEPDEYPAKGIFSREEGRVWGTFRTTTGDYRFLEGIISGDSLKLSTFDGAHAFLFLGQVRDSLLKGSFYSGNHSRELFVGRRNPDYELPDANSLTLLKDSYERLEFEFPDAEGRLVSLDDPVFRNKVVVVQIMGSWCPNCLDETRFLAEYLKESKPQNLEVVALAFEYSKTREKAFEAISRLRKRVGVTYPILLAQYGGSNKLLANQKLPMLNKVLSYPTTVFVDKAGRVRTIHTGFNGPATGKHYERFKLEFDSIVRSLQAE